MKIKLKTSIIVSLMVISVFAAMPAFMVPTAAQGGWNFDTEDPENMPDQIFDGLAGAFGMFEGLGPSGAALGQVFQILFENIMDFQITEFKDVKHVYILNATTTETYNDTWSYDDDEMYFIWKERYQASTTLIDPEESPYVRIQREGSVNVTHTVGASVVFLIWDNDDSFVTAINKVITAAQNVKAAIEAGTYSDEELIALIVSEIVEALVYLFFHINDIINGDELIVLNMVTWESITMETSSDYAVTKTYAVWDDWNLEDDIAINPADLAAWNVQATADDDDFMMWLMEPANAIGAQTIEFSKFSFNIIEIWLKTFQININVDNMMDMLLNGTSGPEPEYALYEIFQGLEIDIYILTHSLFAFIAYDDVDADGIPSVDRTIVTEGDVTSEFVTDSEAEYYFVPKFNAEDVIFHEPEVVTDSDGDKGVKWGIELQNVLFSAIPIGMGYQDVVSPQTNTLDYIELGFTFVPKLKEVVDPDGYSGLAPDMDEVKMSKSVLKLDQYFAAWQGGMGPLLGLDFAVVYMSTIIHFHLVFAVGALETNEQAGLIDEGFQNESVQATGEIKIGDETGSLPVAGVDIAGPGYYLDGDYGTVYPAATTTIPLAWMNMTASSQATYIDTDNPTNSFQAGGFLELETAILIYAVSYPEWDGSGAQIDHDPTFSVFMTWDNPGFWAVILVVAGISLVAVAAILITRRKNRV
ncbi:MAG: hypothetical protein ACTSRE_06020 [Promethearchaeota archaeon]